MIMLRITYVTCVLCVEYLLRVVHANIRHSSVIVMLCHLLPSNHFECHECHGCMDHMMCHVSHGPYVCCVV